MSSYKLKVRAEVKLAKAGNKSGETGQGLPTCLAAMCNIASYIDINLNKYEHS